MATATLEKPYVRGSHVSSKRGRTLAEIRATAAQRRMLMLAWRQAGYPLKDIAAAMGVGVPFVSQELQRAGYARPSLPPLPNTRKSA